jgi:hypothetical protein
MSLYGPKDLSLLGLELYSFYQTWASLSNCSSTAQTYIYYIFVLNLFCQKLCVCGGGAWPTLANRKPTAALTTTPKGILSRVLSYGF